MASARNIAPDAHTPLCEDCGYALIGLPADSRCPECGKPIAESIAPNLRRPPAWEEPTPAAPVRFLLTTFAVLFHTRHFYRTLLTRSENHASARFARIHWLLSAGSLGMAGYFHATRYLNLLPPSVTAHWAMFIGSVALAYMLIALTTEIAARLTAWEAAYRGLRLPLPVVRRGLHYHAPHYLPIAVLAWATVNWFLPLYRCFTGTEVWDPAGLQYYIYVLAAQVILGAVWLFHTYWLAMRCMMYANR